MRIKNVHFESKQNYEEDKNLPTNKWYSKVSNFYGLWDHLKVNENLIEILTLLEIEEEIQYPKLFSTLVNLKNNIGLWNFLLSKTLWKKLCLRTYCELDLLFCFSSFRYDIVIIKQPSDYSLGKK